MSQDSSQPSFELPSPMPDASETGNGGYEAPSATPEQFVVPPVANPAPVASAQPLPVANPIAPIPVSSSQKTPIMPSPTVADDNDLIEKEWVIKAKQIVAATKDDPYSQNKEMSKFKADYLKKRYNKDLKIEDN